MSEKYRDEIGADGKVRRVAGPVIIPAAPASGSRWRLLVLALVVVLAPASLVAWRAVVGAGSEEPPKAALASPSPTTSPSGSAYDAERVAQGIAEAVVNVVATEPDPAFGMPRLEAIIRDAQARTSCDVVESSPIQTAPTKAQARVLVDEYLKLPGSGAAFQRVEYITSRREFAIYAVTVICP